MALSKQISPVSALVTLCRAFKAEGYSIGEMHGFSTVHDVHAKGSWHYDQENGFGKAADINFNGPGEMARLIRARKRAEELGLAVTLAEKGYVSGHADHLHVDLGQWSNLGAGIYRAKGSTGTGYNTVAVETSQDGDEEVALSSEAQAQVAAIVAAEVAKVRRGDEAQAQRQTIVDAVLASIPEKVWGASYGKNGIGPAAMRDWVADTRDLTGKIYDKETA